MMKFICPLIVVIGFSVSANGQEWADKMFPIKKHNFGSVARNSHTEFRFPVKNLYKEDIHIAEVRRSCGCTTPSIEKRVLKTYEVGHIVAHFNTDTFTGKKGATLTVVIDKPYRAEVQLRVDGFIRTDVVFEPNRIDFGKVTQGTDAESAVRLRYAGRSDWAIENVESTVPGVYATARELSRGRGQVEYEIRATIDSQADAGVLRGSLIVHTNDQQMQRVPLDLSGEIAPAVSVSPGALALGRLRPGEEVEKRLVVRSDRPFRLEDLQLDGFQLDYDRSDEPKKMHIIAVKLTAQEPRSIREELTVKTDLPGELRGVVLVTADVAEDNSIASRTTP